MKFSICWLIKAHFPLVFWTYLYSWFKDFANILKIFTSNTGTSLSKFLLVEFFLDYRSHFPVVFLCVCEWIPGPQAISSLSALQVTEVHPLHTGISI